MPEINSQNIEHKILEADIERLSKEIAEKRNLLENKDLSERELIKKSLEPMIKQMPAGKTTTDDQRTISSKILPNYLKNSPDEIKFQVEKLIDAIFHQGLEKTMKQARLFGPFILDAFHDALTDKLYEELKRRKMIN